LLIEENISAWQETVQAGDYYPSLPVKFSSSSKHVEIAGDFDTDSSHTFVDYDILAMQNIIQSEAGDDAEMHSHLNRPFIYVDKSVRVEVLIKVQARSLS